jgi:hypothetical protein
VVDAFDRRAQWLAAGSDPPVSGLLGGFDITYATADGAEEAVVTSNSTVSRDDIDNMSRDEYDRRQNEQFAVFERLSGRVERLLERFGRPDYLPGQPYGDYQVHGDYSEYPQVVVLAENLELLRTPVVRALQDLVREFPGWQIDLMVTLRGHEDWPNMGISIRANEIVDDLQRQYFPKEFQDLTYEGARRGSVLD